MHESPAALTWGQHPYLGKYGLGFPYQLIRRVSRARVAATNSSERAFSSSRARRPGSVSR